MAPQLSSQGTGSRRGTACGPLWPQKLDFTQPTTRRSSRTRSLAAPAHRLARSRVPSLDLDPSRRTQRWNHRTSKIPRATPFIPSPEPPPPRRDPWHLELWACASLGNGVPRITAVSKGGLRRLGSADAHPPLHLPTFPASDGFDLHLSPFAPTIPPVSSADPSAKLYRCLGEPSVRAFSVRRFDPAKRRKEPMWLFV